MCEQDREPRGSAEPPDAVDTDFDNEKLLNPTRLERELGHDLDDEERAYIQVAIRVFHADAKQAHAAFDLFCRIRQGNE